MKHLPFCVILICFSITYLHSSTPKNASSSKTQTPKKLKPISNSSSLSNLKLAYDSEPDKKKEYESAPSSPVHKKKHARVQSLYTMPQAQLFGQTQSNNAHTFHAPRSKTPSVSAKKEIDLKIVEQIEGINQNIRLLLEVLVLRDNTIHEKMAHLQEKMASIEAMQKKHFEELSQQLTLIAQNNKPQSMHLSPPSALYSTNAFLPSRHSSRVKPFPNIEESPSKFASKPPLQIILTAMPTIDHSKNNEMKSHNS